MKIFHSSDHHIKPLLRHEEYKVVFEEFINKVKEEEGEKIIVLTGDYVDEKTQRITPELISFVAWSLKEMAKVCDVYMILGNHDGNLSNKNRQDAISPIINAIDDPRIHLFKQSGIYSIDDQHNFCVFSCFDEKGWDNVKPEPGKINIALFHGGIFGAMTDTGHMFENDIDQTFFDEFDYVLLGDIHKQQYITSDRRIAYAGSFIQQNFGEEIDEHGYLLWDIKSKEDFTVVFKKIKNQFPYVSIEYKDNLEDLFNKSKRYPDGSRFRIISEFPLSEKEKLSIESVLKESKKSNHIIYKPEKKNEFTNLENNNKLKENIRNKTFLINLAKDFVGKNKLSEEQWIEAESVIDFYLHKLSDDSERNVKCHIKRLEFSNLFGYGEDNVIDFSSIDGIVGIMGENSLGKSSIIATIIFSLFGTTDRDLGQGRSHYVINNNKSECFTKIWFTLSGTDYMIERRAVRKPKGDRFTATNFVYFYESKGEVLESIGGVDPVDTNREITKKIGTVEDFLLTNVAAQRNMGRFIDEKSTKRKEIVARFRDMLILDEIFNLVRKDLNVFEGQMKAIDFKNWDEKIEELAEEKIELSNELKALTEEYNLCNEKNMIVSNSLSELEKEERVNPDEIIEKKHQLSEVKREYEVILTKFNQNKEKFEKHNEKIEKLKINKNSIPVENYKEIISSNRETEKSLLSLEKELSHKKELLLQKEKTVSKLKVVPCGDQFPTCLYIKDAHEEKKNIPLITDLISNLENKICEIKSKFIDYRIYEKEIEKFEQFTKEENVLIKELSNFNLKADQMKIEEKEKFIKTLSYEIEKMENLVKEDSNKKIVELWDEQKILSERLKELDKKKLICAQRIGQINSEYVQSRDNKKKYEELNKKYQIYDVLLSIFSKKGIQSKVMKIELPYINREIKNVLEGNVNFSLELEIDEDSDKLEIYLDDEKGGRRPIECCGGMQHVISSMALRFALAESSSLPKTNIIVFDEAFNALDPNHVDSVFKIFYSLKKWFKSVIVISHDERVKNICDMSIEIKENGKYSYVSYE